tara:strand:- start:98 stop:268 length:171 start_codon:yes stop_codon:yes gene_type:complete
MCFVWGESVLDKEQKRQFYRDGYIVIKKAVAPELIESALGRIRSAKKGETLGLSRS